MSTAIFFFFFFFLVIMHVSTISVRFAVRVAPQCTRHQFAMKKNYTRTTRSVVYLDGADVAGILIHPPTIVFFTLHLYCTLLYRNGYRSKAVYYQDHYKDFRCCQGYEINGGSCIRQSKFLHVSVGI